MPSRFSVIRSALSELPDFIFCRKGHDMHGAFLYYLEPLFFRYSAAVS